MKSLSNFGKASFIEVLTRCYVGPATWANPNRCPSAIIILIITTSRVFVDTSINVF
jgi:hypothetical protein